MCIYVEACVTLCKYVGHHEVPIEPLVPNKPVHKLITDESASRISDEPGPQMIDTAVISNVTVTTADESAIISIISTVVTLSIVAVIFCLVSNLCTDTVCCFAVTFDV